MRRVRTTRRDILEKAPAAPDLVKRNFAPGVPDHLRVADITYAGSLEGLLYLAFVLDACSRKVVGWSMANHLRTELVPDALNMAIHNCRPAAGLVHHSDRGRQYTSVSFGGRLKEAGLVPSMGPVPTPTTTPWPNPSFRRSNGNCSTATRGRAAKACGSGSSSTSSASTTRGGIPLWGR